MSKNIAVDSDAKLKKAFPRGVAPPQLLFDFAAWYRDRPAGCIGGLELFESSVEYLLPPQADIEKEFAMFINMPDGGAAGIWLKDTNEVDSAPFVLMDSEGGFYILAPNFACFLDRLAKQQFDPYRAEADFLYNDEGPNLTQELGDWVSAHPIAGPIIQKDGLEDYLPFDAGRGQAWLMAYLEELEAAAFADPDIRALSEILTEHGFRPEPGEFGFAMDSFRVFAAGETMVIKHGAAIIVTKGVNDLGNVAQPLQEKLKPHIFTLRENRAKSKKGAGLWPSATMTIDNEGRVEIVPNYDHEFAIGLNDFSAIDFAVDQKQYARTASKIVDWQKALIEAGKS